MSRSPRSPLTVAVAQPGCESLAVPENAQAHAEAIRRARARVIVFPELSLAGYELQAPALRADDARMASIVDACAEIGTVALVGFPLLGEDGDAYIAMLAVTAAGSAVAYREVWLGAEEAMRFTPGPGPEVLDVDGWRLGLGRSPVSPGLRAVAMTMLRAALRSGHLRVRSSRGPGPTWASS